MMNIKIVYDVEIIISLKVAKELMKFTNTGGPYRIFSKENTLIITTNNFVETTTKKIPKIIKDRSFKYAEEVLNVAVYTFGVFVNFDDLDTPKIEMAP